MSGIHLCLGLVAFAVLCPADRAMAQQVTRTCGDRERIVAGLASRYGETRQSIGLGSKNQVVETWASDETGTWTITVTHPNGLTCLMASGQAFEAVDEALTSGEDA